MRFLKTYAKFIDETTHTSMQTYISHTFAIRWAEIAKSPFTNHATGRTQTCSRVTKLIWTAYGFVEQTVLMQRHCSIIVGHFLWKIFVINIKGYYFQMLTFITVSDLLLNIRHGVFACQYVLFIFVYMIYKHIHVCLITDNNYDWY